MKKYFLSLLFIASSYAVASAQCGVTINTFPYNESFELNTGNWVSGGVFNDWAWGAPNKSIIQSAGDGAKCWIVGGLSGAAYNLDERSYLLSPCFDFTNVPFPHIQFKIYWETENPYDGATLQYTTNNGATWTNVGAANDPIDCLNNNWFNQTNVNALNTLAVPKHGWAGTSLPTVGNCIGGAGSMGWVTAQHTLYNLAGLPNVQFRFAFGAGSVCNSFDGVAIDAVTIQNIPPLDWVAVAPNNISCNGGNTGGINALATGGTGPYTYHLDPVNLTNNNGTFNSLVVGSYTVSATDANGCSISSVVALSQPLPIVFVSINSSNLNCFGDASGSVSVLYNGGIGGLTYTIYPTGATNANGVFNGLNGGNYTIVATDATGCTQSTLASLTQPPAIVISETMVTQPGCNPNNDGIISISAFGGVGNLSYSNGGAFGTDTTFGNLTAGTYTITIKDATGCTKSTLVTLLSVNAPSFSLTGATDVSCFGKDDGTIMVSANGNAPILLYSLQPSNTTSANGVFINIRAGIYTITASDVNGCSNTTVVQVNTPGEIIFESLKYTAGNCGSSLDAQIIANVVGGIGSKTYEMLPGNLLSNNGVFSKIQTAGLYTIVVTDANQCSAIATIRLEERICCDNLIIPNAFSPNYDGKNDEFKVLNLKGIDIKEFVIYNRWGGVVFTSQHIDDRWDGKTKGVENEMGSYYYLIKYFCESTQKEHVVKGELTLIR